MALILLPLSLGKGSATQWATAKVIVPLVFGVLLLPVFVLWEAKWAKSPIFPPRLMKDKHIMCILLLQFFKNMAISARDAYLYDTLVISFNQGTEGATRITSVEGFASTVTVLVVAIVVRRYRVIKPFILVGTILVVVAQGMHINFRGGYSTSQLAGLIAGEIIEGIGSMYYQRKVSPHTIADYVLRWPQRPARYRCPPSQGFSREGCPAQLMLGCCVSV